MEGNKTTFTIEVQYADHRMTPNHKHSVIINNADMVLDDVVREIKGLLLSVGYQPESINEYFIEEE